MSAAIETRGDAPPRPKPPRWARYAVLGTIAVGTVAGLSSTALIAVLAPRDPLLLLALESPLRNLVLVGQRAPLVPYVLIGTIRRVIPAVSYYLFGRWYGEDAVRWLEKRSGPRARQWLRTAERVVEIADVPAVCFFPIAPVGIAAGSLGMTPRVFVTLTTLGSLAIVLTCRFAGDLLARPLGLVLSTLEHHTVAGTAIIVGLLALAALVRHVLGRRAVAVDDAAVPPGDSAPCPPAEASRAPRA